MPPPLPPAMSALWVQFAMLGAACGVYAWHRSHSIGTAAAQALTLAFLIVVLNASLSAALSGVIENGTGLRAIAFDLAKGAAAIVYIFPFICSRLVLAPCVCLVTQVSLSFLVPRGRLGAAERQAVELNAQQGYWGLACFFVIASVAVVQFVSFYKHRPF